MGPYLLRHADAGVGHRDRQLLRPGLEGDGDLAPLGGVFYRVVQQVDPHMAHQLLIARVLRRLQVGGEGDPLFLPGGGEEDGATLDLLVQGVGPLLRDALLGLQLGEQQGAVGQVGQAGGLVQNDLEVLVPLLRGGVRLPEKLGKALDGGDGGLELVGEVVDEVGAQGLDALQLHGHLVKILIGRLEGPALLRLQPLGEVPVGHRPQPPGQAGDHPVEPAAEQGGGDAHHAAHDHQHAQGQHRGGPEPVKAVHQMEQGEGGHSGQGHHDGLYAQPEAQRTAVTPLFLFHGCSSFVISALYPRPLMVTMRNSGMSRSLLRRRLMWVFTVSSPLSES